MNLEKPLVSVIMPAYNAERSIGESIRSVQRQTICDWELLVIDDCSKDKTVEIVSAMAQQDPRIRLYSNEVNSGVAKSRNRALSLSRGKYVAFLDSDDTWHPEKLKVQMDSLESTGADISYTSYAIVDAAGNKKCRDYLVQETVPFEQMLRENMFGCSTVMMTRELGAVHRFEEDFFHEDYVLWLKILQSGSKAVGIREVMVDYFFHEDSKAGNKWNAALQRWKIYREYLHFSTAKSAWYFAQYALAGVQKYRQV